MKFLLSAGLVLTSALVLNAPSAWASASSITPVDSMDISRPDQDGTYKTLPVTSVDECMALCKVETGCRGAVTLQPDVTKPEMECRLNNGFGEAPLFPQTPPTPLDLDIAVAELNVYRAQHGLGPVRLNQQLNSASEVHAADLAQAGIASHTGTDGSSHSERVQRAGYQFSLAAENVATGQKSWDAVFQAWKDSPGHNVNLLQPDVTDFGVALVYEPTTTYSTYWTMLVAAPFKEAPDELWLTKR